MRPCPTKLGFGLVRTQGGWSLGRGQTQVGKGVVWAQGVRLIPSLIGVGSLTGPNKLGVWVCGRIQRGRALCLISNPRGLGPCPDPVTSTPGLGNVNAQPHIGSGRDHAQPYGGTGRDCVHPMLDLDGYTSTPTLGLDATLSNSMMGLDASTLNPTLGLDATVTNSMLDLDMFTPNPTLGVDPMAMGLVQDPMVMGPTKDPSLMGPALRPNSLGSSPGPK
jgi:hypothetical protein